MDPDANLKEQREIAARLCEPQRFGGRDVT